MAGIVIRHAVKSLNGCRISRNFARLLSSSQSNDNHPNILRSDYADVDVPNIPLHEYLFDSCGKYGKNIFIECSVTGRAYTFDDVIKKSKNFGRFIRKKLKLQRGDVIAVLLPNVPEFPIAALGTIAGGCILTTMNPLYTAEEITRQLKDSGAKVIITLSELYPVVKSAIGSSMPIITINNKRDTQRPEGTISFDEVVNSNIDLNDLNDITPENVALMPYSSGTTGLPKGVRLTHTNLLTNLQQIASDDINMLMWAEGDKQDIIPAILPLFHIYGFTTLTCASFNVGAKLLTMPQFLPDLYTKTLIDRKPTVLFVVPPIVIFLNSHPMITKKHLESVRVVMSGAAPLGALDIVKLQQKAEKDITVMQGYGLSESSPAVFIQPHKENTPHGSTGKILPNELIKIMPIDDPNGEPLGPNQTGECYVKGGQVMVGYHNRPKETAETLIDGWLRTGDLFYYDNDRNFYVADRIKELIKVKGFQVPPAELEEILRDHPDVSDAAVIGIPHEISGEVPRAYVVPKQNKQIQIEELNDYVSKKVAEYKRLEGGIEIMSAIPKNASGKILRRELKLKYLAENT